MRKGYLYLISAAMFFSYNAGNSAARSASADPYLCINNFSSVPVGTKAYLGTRKRDDYKVSDLNDKPYIEVTEALSQSSGIYCMSSKIADVYIDKNAGSGDIYVRFLTQTGWYSKMLSSAVFLDGDYKFSEADVQRFDGVKDGETSLLCISRHGWGQCLHGKISDYGTALDYTYNLGADYSKYQTLDNPTLKINLDKNNLAINGSNVKLRVTLLGSSADADTDITPHIYYQESGEAKNGVVLDPSSFYQLYGDIPLHLKQSDLKLVISIFYQGLDPNITDKKIAYLVLEKNDEGSENAKQSHYSIIESDARFGWKLETVDGNTQKLVAPDTASQLQGDYTGDLAVSSNSDALTAKDNIAYAGDAINYTFRYPVGSTLSGVSIENGMQAFSHFIWASGDPDVYPFIQYEWGFPDNLDADVFYRYDSVNSEALPGVSKHSDDFEMTHTYYSYGYIDSNNGVVDNNSAEDIQYYPISFNVINKKLFDYSQASLKPYLSYINASGNLQSYHYSYGLNFTEGLTLSTKEAQCHINAETGKVSCILMFALDDYMTDFKLVDLSISAGMYGFAKPESGTLEVTQVARDAYELSYDTFGGYHYESGAGKMKITGVVMDDFGVKHSFDISPSVTKG